MWINDFFGKIRETLKATKEPIPNQKRCEELAADAYAYCTKLYGQPINPKRPYALIRGVGEASSCSYAWGWYIITLSPELGMIEDQCLTIGHEMYHRFTMHRTGLRRQVWLDETLAVFTSLGFLQQSEFSNIADAIISNSANYPVNIDLRKLRDFHKFPWYAGLMSLGQKYPEDFYQNIVRLAVALKAILSSREFRAYPDRL